MRREEEDSDTRTVVEVYLVGDAKPVTVRTAVRLEWSPHSAVATSDQGAPAGLFLICYDADDRPVVEFREAAVAGYSVAQRARGGVEDKPPGW